MYRFGSVLGALSLTATLTLAQKIPQQRFLLTAPQPGTVVFEELMAGEIPGVAVHRVSLCGPAKHVEISDPDHDVILLILEGKGTLETNGQKFDLGDDTIVHVPLGWTRTLRVADGEALHLVRIWKELTAEDKAELSGAAYQANNAAPYVKKFRETQRYGEAIKSAKTVSRTLLAENHVPRVAIGTVETTGPDRVGAHRHPMLEQFFLGLKSHDVTVIADGRRAPHVEYSLLHIPLGSMHGVEVLEGKKLYYMWMDFFTSKAGQEWLKTHKPETEKPIAPK